MLRLVIGLVFILVPVLELALLIKTGQVIGIGATVALVVTTALTGAFIISQQNSTVLRQTLEAMSEGRPPVAPVLDGLFLLMAGALLLTPGLLTDFVALFLLVPPLRRAVARWSVRWLMRGAHVRVYRGAEEAPRRPSAGVGEGPIIDGEFERLGEASTRPRGGTGHLPS